MAKKKVKPCEECGGPRRGPKAHEPTCSQYKGGSTGKGSKSDGFSIKMLDSLDDGALVKVYERAIELMKGRLASEDEVKSKMRGIVKGK